MTATEDGSLSCAAVAAPPSPANPWVPFPATVVMRPLADTRRTRSLAWSAIRKPPSGMGASPDGLNSCAGVAGPPSPANPPAPLVAPATVYALLVAAPAGAGTAIAAATAVVRMIAVRRIAGLLLGGLCL